MDDRTAGRRAGAAAKAALVWIAILALVGLVVWLASERNARSWYLVPSEGKLVVMRGLMLPAGRAAFASSDPALAQAYAPIVPPAGKPLPPEQTFEERGLLDQAVYEIVARWAREDIASGDPGRLDRGLAYVARAEKLPGLSPAQRDDLAGLRAESAYQEAMRLLTRGVDDLREASDRLRRAASSQSPHASAAGALLRDLEPAVDAAAAVLRKTPEARPAGESGPPPPDKAPPGDTPR